MSVSKIVDYLHPKSGSFVPKYELSSYLLRKYNCLSSKYEFGKKTNLLRNMILQQCQGASSPNGGGPCSPQPGGGQLGQVLYIFIHIYVYIHICIYMNIYMYRYKHI